MTIRKGKEIYKDKYDQAINLHKKGISVTEIAKTLQISYSCAYHWVKGLRKPESGNVNGFISALRSKGPLPVVDIKERFPKHNELFLTASRRGLPIMRKMLNRNLKEFSTWYFIKGQEKELDKRVTLLYDKIRNVKEMLKQH